MSVLGDQLKAVLVPGMELPNALEELFAWIEANKFYVDRDGQRYGMLFDEQKLKAGWTDVRRPGGTTVEFVARGREYLDGWFGHDRPEVLNRLCVFAQTGGEGFNGGVVARRRRPPTHCPPRVWVWFTPHMRLSEHRGRLPPAACDRIRRALLERGLPQATELRPVRRRSLRRAKPDLSHLGQRQIWCLNSRDGDGNRPPILRRWEMQIRLTRFAGGSRQTPHNFALQLTKPAVGLRRPFGLAAERGTVGQARLVLKQARAVSRLLRLLSTKMRPKSGRLGLDRPSIPQDAATFWPDPMR